MAKPVKHFYAFGSFRLDPAEKVLLGEGRAIPLTPKVFDTLLLLVERSGQLIEKDEFLQRLWPGTFVEEGALAQNISVLRKALGDAADGQRFIATVPKRGYRFVAPVERVSAAEAVAPRPRPRATLARGLAVALVVVLGAGYLALRREGGIFFRSAAPPIRSVAVLPLDNLSRNPEEEYLADGMTEELITNLAKVGALRVISRTSVMRYKGTIKPLPEIARELDVDAIVEGTVLRSPGRVHLTVQLIRARPEQHVWAESYDRPRGDAAALQAALAREIASVIRAKLTPQEQARLAISRPVDPEAHELYLKGRYFWNKRNAAALNKAVEYFQQAIARQPDYAEAYSGLADSYVLLGGYDIISPSEAAPKARAAAEKALELDSSLAEAHTSLALVLPFFDWNWPESKRHFEQAIALNPNYATAHHWYGDAYLMPMGKMDEAIAEVRLAEKLDPLSPIIVTDVGKNLYFARRYDEAIGQFRKALEIDPNFSSAHGWLLQVYMEKQMYTEALAMAEKYKPFISPAQDLAVRAQFEWRVGNKAKARKLLAQVVALSREAYVSPGLIGTLYGLMGERDQAFAWLEKAFAEKSAYMTSLQVWSIYDPIRSDARFDDLIRRVRLNP